MVVAIRWEVQVAPAVFFSDVVPRGADPVHGATLRPAIDVARSHARIADGDIRSAVAGLVRALIRRRCQRWPRRCGQIAHRTSLPVTHPCPRLLPLTDVIERGRPMRTIAFAFALTLVALTAQAGCGDYMSAGTAKTTITADAAPIQTPIVTPPSGS